MSVSAEVERRTCNGGRISTLAFGLRKIERGPARYGLVRSCAGMTEEGAEGVEGADGTRDASGDGDADADADAVATDATDATAAVADATAAATGVADPNT